MIITYRNVCILVLVFFTFSCQNVKDDAILEAQKNLPEELDFNFHIKPILSDKCFACHGPDADNRKADLRLDTREGAIAALTNESGQAIVPGKLSKSHAYLRIISDDPNLVMPPPESHLNMTTEEIAMLATWIEQGAEYKPHWSFIPVEETAVPTVDAGDRVENEIDNFILAKLEEENLTLSSEADKETLIRRVTFDLTGLPPTLAEIDDFLEDTSPDAYERLVDRLLSSKYYGERMAANWMDIARYADSDGYLDDKHRDFSPWRSWVIEAFNKNMSYKQFITWQLAGDLLPDASQESILATAFNRLHKKNSEAGIVFEEYRVEYVADRANTVGTSIMGISMECARCHDHKYDPISQKNYFELFSFFNSTFEIGTPVYGHDVTPGPSLLLSNELEQEEIDDIKAMIEQLEGQLETNEKQDSAFENWLTTKPQFASSIRNSLNKCQNAHYTFDAIRPAGQKGRFSTPNEVAGNKPAILQDPIIDKGVKGDAFFVSDYNKAILGDKIGWFDRMDAFSVQLWVRPDTVYEEAGIFWHSENLRVGSKGYSMLIEDNKLQFLVAHAWPQNALQVTTKKALSPHEWAQVTVTYDGSSKAKGISIYLNGEKQEVSVDYNNLYKGISFIDNIHTYGFKGFMLGARDKYIPFKKGGIDEISIYDRDLSALEVLYTYDVEKTLKLANGNDAARKAWLREYFFKAIDTQNEEVKTALKKSRTKENQLLNQIPEIMVMGDLPEPRKTYVLDRGAYDAPSEEVSPNTPNSILPFDESLPKNRLGLTEWLFDPQNPLISRVYVNRIWQMHFGKGIVKTSEDFGGQGSLPTHPELLDWLALYFMENGWDIKDLHKLILTSATYKQQSKISKELLEKDPENLLLARGSRYRMPAEMIRDNALAISGLLVDKQGGQSTYPYQPEGLWDGLTTKPWAYKYLQEPGEGLYRRSLYSFWKRQSPPPMMQIFDVGDRGVCNVRRTISSTPLQALNLLNDPQFVEASRVFAEGLIKSEDSTSNRLNKAFRTLTGRIPDTKEEGILADFYEEELQNFEKNKVKALAFLDVGEKEKDSDLDPVEVAALGVVINSIMNTTEAFTKK